MPALISTILRQPFLTVLDPRDRTTGSRDPLGIQSLWTRLGRAVIGNLTTQTTSWQDFITTMVGYWLIEVAREEKLDVQPIEIFLKWEQLAAYVRVSRGSDDRIRGIERVRRRLEDNQEVQLSAAPSHQLLSNQRIYGLWGIYSVASAQSGLVSQDPIGVPAAMLSYFRTHVENRLSCALLPDVERLLDFLAPEKRTVDLGRKHRQLADAVASLYPSQPRAAERALFREHLVLGGPVDSTAGNQQVLARAMAETDNLSGGLNPQAVLRLKKACEKESPRTAQALENLVVAESVFAPAAVVFEYLLQCDRSTMKETAANLADTMGAKVPARAESFEPIIMAAADAAGEREAVPLWMAIAHGLATGDYGSVIENLLQVNERVVGGRALDGAGVPWATIERGTVRVRRAPQAPVRLPNATQLKSLWRHPYFLPSLAAIQSDLGGESP